jgi:DNA polymerase/3'-5' exonuclease PolX
MNWGEANRLALSVTSALSPYCVKCEVAGSVRRRKPDRIKDVEIVLIPRSDSLHELAALINDKWGKPTIGKWPAKYTKIRGLHAIDIFTASRENFPLLFFIRTGPADYVMKALAEWKRISSGGYSDGAVLRTSAGVPFPLHREEDVFTALNRPWVDPEKRFATSTF